MLRRRSGGCLLLGSLVSGFGDSLVPLALAFAVLAGTGSVVAFGLALASSRLPQLVVTLIGGVVGDRRSPRAVALAAAAACLVLNLGCAVVLAVRHDARAVVALVVLQTVAASASAFGAPAAGKVLRSAYPDPAELDAATAFAGTSRSVTHIVAQGASGLLVFAGSPALCFALNAATYAALGAALLAVREEPVRRVAGRRRSHVGDLAAGLRGVGGRPQFAWALANLAVCWLLVVQPFLLLGPAVLRQADAGSASLARGLVGAAIGAGGIAGGVVSHRFAVADRLTWVVLLGLADVPVFVVLAVRPTSWLVFPFAFLTGAQSTLARIWLNQELYRLFPQSLTGRVQSLLAAGWLLPAFVASIAVPPIAEAVGLRRTLLLLVAAFVAVNAVMAVQVARRRPPRPAGA